MTKQNFLQLLTEELKKYFPQEEYEMRGDVFLKNNNTKKYGIIIRRISGAVAPTVYIDHFYDDYCKKKNTIEEIAVRIHSALKNIDEQETQYYSFSADYSVCKEKIIYRLVSKERNEQYLSGIPHLAFLDLAIVFLVVHRLSGEGMESFCITNELQKKWNVSTKDLFSLAHTNTQKIFPPVVDTLEHTMSELLGELINDIPETQDEACQIYILSNQPRINGAAAILYEDLIQKLAEKMNCDFYILPSSIHELLLLPDNNNDSLESLSHMVKDINENHVKEEEILSDHAYYYSREEKKFFM